MIRKASALVVLFLVGVIAVVLWREEQNDRRGARAMAPRAHEDSDDLIPTLGIADDVPGSATLLRGQVVDQLRRPVANATVTTGLTADALRTCSDRDGRFTLALPDGPECPIFAARAGMRLRQLMTLRLPVDGDVMLELPGGATLRGRVVDRDSGAPVGNVDLEFVVRSGEDLCHCDSSAESDGKYEVSDIPPGVLVGATITRGDCVVVHLPAVGVVVDSTAIADVTVSRGCAVDGRVVCRGEVGVRDALVRFVSRATSAAPLDTRLVTTDADGHFAARVPNGRYLVTAECMGYVQDGPPPCLTEADMRARLDVDPPVQGVYDVTGHTLHLHLAMNLGDGHLRGSVRAATTGRPIEGATVRVGGHVVHSDSAGAFEASGFVVQQGLVTAVRVEAAGYESAMRLLTSLPADGLRVELPEMARVTGTVVGPDGPVSGATVLVIREGGLLGPRSIMIVPVNERGVFGEQLPWGSGEVSLEATAPGYSSLGPQTVRLSPGEDTNIRLRIDTARTIAGIVRYAVSGAPVVGAAVLSGTEERAAKVVAFTDSSGAFRIGSAHCCVFGALARVSGVESPWTIVDVDQTQIVLDVPELGTVTGRVLYADGSGAKGVPLILRSTSTVLQAVSDDEGIFRFARARGEAMVEVDAAWCQDNNYERVSVPKVASGAEGIVLRLAKGGVVAGRLLWDDGTAVSYADVAAHAKPERRVLCLTRTDEDGGFALRGIPDGSFLLWIRPPGRLGGMPLPSECRELRPNTTGLAITLSGITGRILDESSGAPVAAMRLRVFSVETGERGPYEETVTGEDGSFSLRGLPVGEYRVVDASGAKDVLPACVSATARNVVLHAVRRRQR